MGRTILLKTGTSQGWRPGVGVVSIHTGPSAPKESRQGRRLVSYKRRGPQPGMAPTNIQGSLWLCPRVPPPPANIRGSLWLCPPVPLRPWPTPVCTPPPGDMCQPPEVLGGLGLCSLLPCCFLY